MKRLFTLFAFFCLFIASFAYDVEVDGIYYNLNNDDKTAAVTSGSSKYSGDITIPASIISNGVVYDVTSIGKSAFWCCSGLTSVTIGNSVTSIGKSAFAGCSSLTEIDIPNSVNHLLGEAFNECSRLTSVKIGNSVTSIGNSAFSSCNSLTKAEFASVESLCAISFGDYRANPLYYAKHLYINGEEVKDLFIPNSVTSIGNYAFYSCSGLTSVTIGNSVTSIVESAFEGCYRLMTINVLTPVPPTCDKNIFICTYNVRDQYDIYNYTTLHVPMGSKEYYSSAYEWRYFAKIKEDMQMDGQAYYTTLSVNQGNNGYVQHYVKADDTYTLYIGTENHGRVNTVLFNGVDVTDQLVDGYYTTPAITQASKLSISFEQSQDMPALINDNLHVYGYEGRIYVSGLDGYEPMMVYSIDGKLIHSIKAAEDTCFDVSDGDYVVKVGERTFKVVL